MTKAELVTELAQNCGVTKRHAEYVLIKLTTIIEAEVSKGNKVAITGFGTFDRGMRKKRRGINPITKKHMMIPAMPTPRFRAGTRFKNSLR